MSMEQKLKRRKLDALKRGVHRMPSGQALPVSTHVVGIGKAGIGAIVEMVRGLDPHAPRLHALAIDIGEQDLGELRALAATVPEQQAKITIVALDMPARAALFEALSTYRDYLMLECPNAYGRKGSGIWLPPSMPMPERGGHVPRALAKAVFGLAYYAGARPMERCLRDFAADVEAAAAQPVIAIVFGLGGGTGSGIAVDLARHISTRLFGRRVLVTGIGIAPCDGDTAERDGTHAYPVLNELDCLGDEGKNDGIVAPCGELFRNPFTAGFIVVPQQHVWTALGDMQRTHQRIDRDIAALLTGRAGANMWEMLRLLNWVGAPSTQHSAARTPWGAKWIHMLGIADAGDGPIAIDADLPRRLGLLASYSPEFIELRVAETADADVPVDRVHAAFAPDVAPQAVGGGRPGCVQFILPCISKTDLALFYRARDAYDTQSLDERTMDHSMLLEQGVLLSEPSTRLAGMAGGSVGGSEGWTAVPFDRLRGGEQPEFRHAAAPRELVSAGAA